MARIKCGCNENYACVILIKRVTSSESEADTEFMLADFQVQTTTNSKYRTEDFNGFVCEWFVN